MTISDVHRVLEDYLSALLSAGDSYMSVACSPAKVDEVAEALEKDHGFGFTRIDDIESSIFARAKYF